MNRAADAYEKAVRRAHWSILDVMGLACGLALTLGVYCLLAAR